MDFSGYSMFNGSFLVIDLVAFQVVCWLFVCLFVVCSGFAAL